MTSHRIFRCYMAVMTWFVVAAAACAQSIEQQFAAFEQSQGKEQTAAANKLARTLYDKEHTDSLYTFTETDSTTAFSIYCLMGWYYSDLSEYDKSLNCCEKAERYYNSKVEDDEYASLCNQISNVLTRKGNFYRAIDYMKKCYEIDLKTGDKANLSSSLSNLANLYLVSRQPAQGREFADKAVAIERELGHDDRLAVRLGTASEIYMKLGQAQKALDLATEAYELDSKGGRTGKAAIRQTEMAAAYIGLGRLQEAEKAMLQAIPVLEQEQNHHSLAICHNQFGTLLLKQGKREEAVSHFEESLRLSREVGNIYVEQMTHHGLYEALRQDDPVEAIRHLLRYSQLSDSMYNADLANYSSLFHTRYHADELTESNNQLSHENEEQRKLTRRIMIASLLAILLLVGLLSLLYYAFRVRTKANRLMKKVEEMRLDFFTKVTHEFRTPLTVIIGLSDNIAKGQTAGEEDVKNAAAIIHRNGQYINKLTNQLLDLSRLRSDIAQPQWKHGNIYAYTVMITESFRLLGQQRDIHVQYLHEGPQEMDFVPDYYTKTLHNLLSNALKFTPEGGHIDVITRIADGQFTLTVSDDGQGIDEKDMPYIFEEFYLPETDKSSIGTGVGLALVKQITETMNGDIHVESELGKGTRFVITTPYRNDPTLPEADKEPAVIGYADINVSNADESSPTGTELPRILVVEDNADVRQYIGSLLRKTYEVAFAHNGQEGMDKALDIIPDLILTDLVMPGTDGLALCRQIRANELLSHIPVVVVTAKITDEDRLQGIEAGADAYLTKPFNPEELMMLTGKLLEHRKALREKFSQTMEQSPDNDPKETLSETDRKFIDKFTVAVNEQMTKCQTDVETIASMMCVSSKQLRRKIFAITGETTAAYIQHLKLARAKELLSTRQDLPVADIATMSGFDDNAHFSKVFKQYYQVTPSQFRAENKL